MQNSNFLDLSKFDVNDFESLLNTSFRQIGSTYRAKEHSSYVIKKGHDDILRFTSFNGDFGDKPLHIYSLAKYINPNYSYTDILRLLKEPVKRSFEPVKELSKNDNVTSEKTLVFSDNTSQFDLQTLRYFQQKCNIESFSELNEFGVFPIESYGKMQSKYMKTPFFAYKETNFLGESLKLKDSNKTILQNKVILKSNIKEYCFGLDYVSKIKNKKDIVILVCEGEDDVITINKNCQHIKAVTFGGVTNHFNKDVLSFLDNQFKGVFICFDNDSSGKKGAKEQGEKHALLNFSIKNPLTNDEKYKDVSDLFKSVKQIVTDKSKQSVEFEMLLTCQINDCINAYNTELERIRAEKRELERIGLEAIEKERIRLERIEKEREKIERQHKINKILGSGQLEVTRYISEKSDLLIDALNAFDRVLIHGNTHTGKTYFVCNLVNEIVFAKLEIKRIIYVVPRKFLGNDIANELSKNVNTSFIDGAANKDEIAHALTCKIIVVTMDSLTKFDNVLDESMLVLDEIQKNESDSSFRNAPQNVLERLNIPKKVLAITATPNTILYNELGFKYIRIESKERQKQVNTVFADFERIVGRENKATYKESILHYINTSCGKTCVLLNDKTDLNVIKDCLTDKKAILITSETCEAVLNNDVLGIEKLSSFDVFLCTSVVDAGVNLRFHIDRFITPFNTKTYDAVQLVGRDRTEIKNELIILNKIKDSEPEPKPIPNYQKVLTEAQTLCDVLNKCPNLININTEKEKYNSLKPMERQYLFWDKIQNRYCVDYFGLANDCYTHPLTNDEYFKALQNYDNAFSNYSNEYLDFNECTDNNIELEQKETLKQIEIATTKVKVQRDESKQKAIELIQSKGVETVASEVSKFTKNVNLKKDLKGLSNFGSCDIDNEIRPFVEKALSKIVNISKYTDVKKTGFLSMNDSDYKAFKGVLMTQKELRSHQNLLTPLELKRQIATENLQKELTKLKVNDVKSIGKYLKAVEKSDLYGNEKVSKIDTLESKLQRIFELFDFETVEKNGKLVGLELKKQWNLGLIETVFSQDLPVKRHKTKSSEFRNDILHLEDLLYNDAFVIDLEREKERIFAFSENEICPF